MGKEPEEPARDPESPESWQSTVGKILEREEIVHEIPPGRRSTPTELNPQSEPGASLDHSAITKPNPIVNPTPVSSKESFFQRIIPNAKKHSSTMLAVGVGGFIIAADLVTHADQIPPLIVGGILWFLAAMNEVVLHVDSRKRR